MSKIPRISRVVSIGDVPSERKVPRMIRVPAIEPIVGVVVSDSIFALRTHYVEGFTKICPGPEVCEHCDTVSMKWYGLIAVWDRNDSSPKWIQLTAQAATALLNEVARRQVSLHGLNVRIARERKTKNAPIVVAIDEYARTQSRLPKPLDPQETIEAVFGSARSSGPRPPKAVM